eukprot:9081067-Pyramimonas_sp.AAC.1
MRTVLRRTPAQPGRKALVAMVSVAGRYMPFPGMGRTADLPEHRTLAATLAAASQPLRIPRSQDRIHFASSSPSAAPARAAT